MNDLGLYVWVDGVDFYPPRVYCVIEAATRYAAEAKAETFAQDNGLEPPETGDVYEIDELKNLAGVWKP